MISSPNTATYADEAKVAEVAGRVGRDTGKTFRVHEVPPVAMAGFVLRLLAAMRLAQQDDLLALLQPVEGSSDLGGVLRLLTGCDPQAVSALLHDALDHVEVAADPRHPTAFRVLHDNDIREMGTLGDILGAFVRVNLLPG